jgi:hypothetical protein
MYQDRPIRRASEIARKRIRAIAREEESGNAGSILERAKSNGYNDTLHIIQYLLTRCNEAKFEDEKCEIVKEILTHLILNPSILIYESKFRSAVLDKIAEIETHIQDRRTSYNKANYKEALDVLMISMRVNIRNSKIRQNMYRHIQEIRKSLNHYERWTDSSLKTTIKQMRDVLENIKEHPEYITA